MPAVKNGSYGLVPAFDILNHVPDFRRPLSSQCFLKSKDSK